MFNRRTQAAFFVRVRKSAGRSSRDSRAREEAVERMEEVRPVVVSAALLMLHVRA